MVQRREHVSLASEAREPIGIESHGGGQDLQRDIAIELRIARAIDLTHAAGPDCADDLVRANARARGQRHSVFSLNPYQDSPASVEHIARMR